MLESLGVLAVCISSWLLYERGDGWDSLFLVLFSLIQLIDDQSTKLFWKCFLPSLVLCQYVFKHYSNPSSRVRGLVARGFGAGAARRRKPSSPSSPESAAAETPRGRAESESSQTRTSRVRSSTTSSKLYKGSLKLSRRTLTLACHLNVIKNTIHHSPMGARVNDELELAVYAAILVYVFFLPVYPAVSIIAISLVVQCARGVLDHWDCISSFVWPNVVHISDMALHAVWGTDMQQLQCRITDAMAITQPAEAAAGQVASATSLAYLVPRMFGAAGACYAFISEYTRHLCAVMVDNEECMYAMVLLSEPHITNAMLRLFAWLGMRGRSRHKETISAAASP